MTPWRLRLSGASATGGPSELRADIQALRAMAVAAVLLYHLWPGRVPGGYTGVDVFFVISGFLICGNLVREGEATGRIDVLRFWARRVRRLLPAALLVLAASALAVVLLVQPSVWPRYLEEVIASTFYVQNWTLAARSVDYLATDTAVSPLQHFWTLSVEEQFYVLTPLVLLALLARARSTDRRLVMLGGLLVIGVASFTYSVLVTAVSSPFAYFATTARAWEFAVGGLLVFAPRPPSRRLAQGSVVVGLVLVATATWWLRAGLPFPGPAAAWPVAGAAALIWGGAAAGGPYARLAALRPVRWVGDTSYAIYLWHWPLVVLLPIALGHSLHTAAKIAVIVATLLLAGMSTHWIENPVRHSPRLLGGTRRTRHILAWGGAGMAAVAMLAGAGMAANAAGASAAVARSAALEREYGSCLGAAALVNSLTCEGTIPSDVLVPGPDEAARDRGPTPECFAGAEDGELRICSLGPADATVRLAAVGDSHGNALFAAYQALADTNGWRIDVAAHSGCPWSAALLERPTPVMGRACAAWRQAVTLWLGGGAPYDAVIITAARGRALPVEESGKDRLDVAVSGFVDAWAVVEARGTQIIAIRDNPQMQADVIACALHHPDDAGTACAQPASRGLGGRDLLAEAVNRSAGAHLIDLSAVYCPDATCPPVINHVLVYRDSHHLTSAWARSLVPLLASEIRAALP